MAEKYYALVIEDSAKQLAFIKELAVRVHTDDFHRREGRAPLPYEHQKITRVMDERYQPAAKGSLHTIVASLECPDGLPNCRNCGDPAFLASCRVQGHCAACGTRHGIIPEGHVAAGGYRLVELTGDQADLAARHHLGESMWNEAQQMFVAREPIFPRALAPMANKPQ